MAAVAFGVFASSAYAQSSSSSSSSSTSESSSSGSVLSSSGSVSGSLGSDSSSSGSDSSSSGAGTDIHGVLADRRGTSDTKDDTFVSGARVFVTGDDGKSVGEDVTASDGSFKIELPGEGHYVTSVDPETLPKGVKFANSPIDSSVNPGQSRPLNFEINAAARAPPAQFDQFLQALVDGTNFGLIIAMCAVGLSLIYGTTRLVTFAHGELVALGAIVASYFNRNAGWPLLLAAPMAVAVCGGFGYALEAGFW